MCDHAKKAADLIDTEIFPDMHTGNLGRSLAVQAAVARVHATLALNDTLNAILNTLTSSVSGNNIAEAIER